MKTFSVYRELEGGTTKTIEIYNMPERLIRMFDNRDIRTEWERQQNVNLTRSETMRRALYFFFMGTCNI